VKYVLSAYQLQALKEWFSHPDVDANTETAEPVEIEIVGPEGNPQLKWNHVFLRSNGELNPEPENRMFLARKYPQPKVCRVVEDMGPYGDINVGEEVVLLDNDDENSIHLVWKEDGLSSMGKLTTCDFGCLEEI
jgi:hypothetical protein